MASMEFIITPLPDTMHFTNLVAPFDVIDWTPATGQPKFIVDPTANYEFLIKKVGFIDLDGRTGPIGDVDTVLRSAMTPATGAIVSFKAADTTTCKSTVTVTVTGGTPGSVTIDAASCVTAGVTVPANSTIDYTADDSATGMHIHGTFQSGALGSITEVIIGLSGAFAVVVSGICPDLTVWPTGTPVKLVAAGVTLTGQINANGTTDSFSVPAKSAFTGTIGDGASQQSFTGVAGEKSTTTNVTVFPPQCLSLGCTDGLFIFKKCVPWWQIGVAGAAAVIIIIALMRRKKRGGEVQVDE